MKNIGLIQMNNVEEVKKRLESVLAELTSNKTNIEELDSNLTAAWKKQNKLFRDLLDYCKFLQANTDQEWMENFYDWECDLEPDV